jgi:hypothetical protein
MKTMRLNPWPQIQTRGPVTALDLGRAFVQKTAMRTLLAGGPLAQPAHLWPFRGACLDGFASPVDFSADSRFLAADSRIPFANFARDIAAGTIDLPIIFKPNGSAEGRRIFILHDADDDHVRVTLPLAASGPHRWHAEATLEATDRIHSQRWQIDETRQIAQRMVTREALATWLPRLWEALTRDVWGEIYDAGMAEPYIARPGAPVVHHDGQAFETRHPFVCSLATGKSRLLGDEGIGKIGSSPFVATITNRPSARELPFPLMYDPLVASGALAQGDWGHFSQFVDVILRDAIDYLLSGLEAAGLSCPLRRPITGCFDLLWQHPEGTDRLPRPLLVESVILLLGQEDSTILRHTVLA